MTLYWASIEFDIINPPEYENCIGGFVYLFFNAIDKNKAADTIETALANEGLRVNRIEFVMPYDENVWETKEDQEKYNALATEAKSGNEVVWDEIFAYEFKDE